MLNIEIFEWLYVNYRGISFEVLKVKYNSSCFILKVSAALF